MHFNTGKCNILTMPNSGKHHPIFYNINGQILQQFPTAKYLGIIATVHIEKNTSLCIMIGVGMP